MPIPYLWVVTLARHLQIPPRPTLCQLYHQGLVQRLLGWLRGKSAYKPGHCIHPSTAQCPEAISQYISEERAAAGPLPESATAYVLCCPIWFVPKGEVADDCGPCRLSTTPPNNHPRGSAASSHGFGPLPDVLWMACCAWFFGFIRSGSSLAPRGHTSRSIC